MTTDLAIEIEEEKKAEDIINVSPIFPEKTRPLFSSKKRYIVLYGGRGSAKSWTIAHFLIFEAMKRRIRILCAREVQNSIKDSVHKLLSDLIQAHGLTQFFKVTDNSIRSINGSEFIFKGLWNNENGIRSTEGVDYCWVEEAHSVSMKSLRSLTPTIRKKGSQVIFSYNPENEEDPVHSRYTLPAEQGNRKDVELIKINYFDNPHFPDELRDEMEYDKENDYNAYLHIWEGQCIIHTEAQIMAGKFEVKDFETPEGVSFRMGGDFGGGPDPMTLVRMFIKDECLWIDYEAYGLKVDIEDYEKFYDLVPESRKHKIVADSSRPESIRYLRNKGFFVVPSKKGPNSIVEGIQRIRKFKKVYIHSRCKHTADEFKFYSYKQDKRTGEISNIPDDKHNHCIDPIRYATEDLIMMRRKVRVRTVKA